MNYNDWFYDQYKYLQGERDGVKSYNDTKWVGINDRYAALIEMSSELLNDQPFGVMGNTKAFDRLIDLMARSNYTFEDINESLVSSYKKSLKNVMGNMLVDSSSSIFCCKSTDSRYVSIDKFSQDYIIDVPFNQLHFGERDEFIRQQLSKMYNSSLNNYMSLNEFLSSEVNNILGFSFLCCVNGMITNDVMIALDDKGFRFKVGWLYSSDVEFIIYMLSEAVSFKCEIPLNDFIADNRISNKFTNGLIHIGTDNHMKCLVNIFDSGYIKTVSTVPNFGEVNGNGDIVIHNLQQYTINSLNATNPKMVTFIVYVFKYFYELPNIYPAVNYYDIMDSRRVYVDGDNVVDINNKKVLASNPPTTELPICTPPISLDRPINLSFNTIMSCMKIKNDLMKYESTMISIGNTLNNNNLSQSMFQTKVKDKINEIYSSLNSLYIVYIRGSILTSLVPYKNIERFERLLNSLNDMRNADVSTCQNYTINEYFDENYRIFADVISSPFNDNSLSNFVGMDKLTANYFTMDYDNSDRFNRPISTESIITLKYDRDKCCWIFSYPKLNNFKGIGNTFYIEEELKGDELFKFFVLYPNTQTPNDNDAKVSQFDFNTIMDFDKFYEEADKHIGFVKYWNTENKLMKISKLLYNKESTESTVQVLSKILRGEIEADDILKQYPSDINYEASSITSLGVGNDNSDIAPFALNYLFYTLNMINGNEDKLQAYLYNTLTKNKFQRSFVDMDVTDVVKEKNNSTLVNYSQISVAPNGLDIPSSSFNSSTLSFFGSPLIVNNGVVTNINAYRYMFNVFENNQKIYSINKDGINKDYYIRYPDTQTKGHSVKYYNNDARVCQLISFYLNNVSDRISLLKTNYSKSYNQSFLIQSSIIVLSKIINEIRDYSSNHTFEYPDTTDMVNSIINHNPIINILNQMKTSNDNVTTCMFNSRTTSTEDLFNGSLLLTLRNINKLYGFDDKGEERIKALYKYLCKYNKRMNLYQYYDWVSGIDLTGIHMLDDILAKNDNNRTSSTTFSTLWSYVQMYIPRARVSISEIKDYLYDLDNTIKTTHIDTLTNYCKDMVLNKIFDLYVIDKIVYNKASTYVTEPFIISTNIPVDNHFKLPGDTMTGSVSLTLHPTINKPNNYVITSINPVCEYVFFNGSDISCTLSILSSTGSSIGTTSATIKFKKIGSSSDISDPFEMITPFGQTIIDVENNHEEYEIHNDKVINNGFTNMNYDLIVGQKYKPLNHETEMILHAETYMPGSVDRVIIDNSIISDTIKNEYSSHDGNDVWFKASRVLHDTNSVVTSVGNNCYVGKQVYLTTDDGLFTFPVKVTAIDHSQNHGFVEAEIDKCEWIKLSNDADITKYMTTDVECSVLPDNISNFMNEYSNDYYEFTNVMKDYRFNNNDDVYTLPGDPIYVQNNTPYVYTRLNHFFNEDIPNRFIDDEHKKFNFVYMGDSFIKDTTSDVITIKMINHDFNTFTKPELYPILRDEPNDHEIWNEQTEVFDQRRKNSKIVSDNLKATIERIQAELQNVTTEDQRRRLIFTLEDCQSKYNYQLDFQNRLTSYIEQREYPTTWYNVYSYEDTLTYIENGRSETTFISNIRDVPYTDDMDVFIYDWENKVWVDPSSYTVTSNILNEIKLDEYEDYKTNNILYSITITPNNHFNPSSKLLVYFAYERSNVFDDIPTNTNTCDVRFKNVISMNKPYIGLSYKNIMVRKHLNSKETYVFDEYNSPTDFSNNSAFYLKRFDRNGKTTSAPLRLHQLTVSNDSNEYTYEDFDMYVRIPFKDVTIHSQLKSQTFNAVVRQPIDHSINTDSNQPIKLICVNNNHFDGNISDIMFNATLSYDGDNQIVTVESSSLNNIDSGTYVCTVFQDREYKQSGGLIVVTVTVTDVEDLIDSSKQWMRIPNDLNKYRLIPDECIFVPKDDTTININKLTKFIFINAYEKDSSDEINNSNINSPYEFYYNNELDLCYPVSDTRHNQDDRLIINKSTNTNVKVIKTTHVCVCRFNLQTIPKDGIIDVTGYIPTPLTRDRYKVYVNGTDLTHTDKLIILSPTSLQLHDLKSLRNFELLEIVDDMNDSSILPKGNVYVTLSGKTFSSYNLALLSNQRIINQRIHYMFNSNQHELLQDYTKPIINPNNVDIEIDILSTIIFDNIPNPSYNDIYNIPTINGIPLKHLNLKDLPFDEISNLDIANMFDKVWKKEIITNPLFLTTHRDGMELKHNEKLKLHVKNYKDKYIIYVTGVCQSYFSLYISENRNDNIYDTSNTLKIIPYIKCGVYVIIDKEYHGKWIHSTFKTDSIIIK